MADFSTIYVDLSKTDSAPDEYKDENGAVICDDTTLYGTELQQLTYVELRKYLQYRSSDRDITFLLKNKIEISYAYYDDIFTVKTGTSITIDSQSPNESFKIKHTYIVPSITVYNSNLHIYNMDLDLYGAFTFIGHTGDQYDASFNKLYLENCRFWCNTTDYYYGEQYMLKFNTFSSVVVSNCIFNNKSSNNNVAVLVQHSTTSEHNISGFTFFGCIFVRVNNLYERMSLDAASDFNELLSLNVFTESENSFRDSTPDSSIFNFVERSDNYSPDNNYYGWNTTIPPVCDADLYDAENEQDFDYLSNTSGWIGVNHNVIGADSQTKELLSTTHSYGERDGIGALYFKPMGDVYITSDKYLVDKNEDVNFYNIDPIYDSNYYSWYVDGELQSTTTHIFTYTVVSYGSPNICAYIWSPNRVYYRESCVNIISLIDFETSFISITTYDMDGNEKDEFRIGETVKIVITNISDNDDIIDNVDIKYNDSRDTLYNISCVGCTETLSTTYYILNDQIIDAVVNNSDGRNVYMSKHINIVDNVFNTYYVDFDAEYSEGKWLYLEYGIYDDFEDKSINNNFYQEFKSYYNVIYMYDEYVANGHTEVIVMKGITEGEFVYEGSIVRNTIEEIPSVGLYIDNNHMILEWHYMRDALKLYNNDELIISKEYGHFSKDLTCLNALHKITFKFICDGDGLLSIYYKINDIWILLTYYFLDAYNNISCFIKGTLNTGFGYIGIQAEHIDDSLWTGFGNGTEEYPYSFEEFYDRVRYDDGTGEMFDTYLCRNYRRVTNQRFFLDLYKQFYINVWDPHKYGPWMLEFFNMKNDISFQGNTISNGIITNISTNQHLYITNIYDMFITWNGNRGIILYRTSSKYSNDDITSNIIGSTIKSVGQIHTNLGE